MRVLISEKLSEHKYKTPEGYLICTDAILARTGKQTYTRDELFGDGDNTEVNVDRPYDEVMNEKTIASFENKPVTFDHPDEDVNIGNYKSYAVGYVRDVRQGKVDGKDVILGNLVITDEDAINAIENGDHTDLSCGYDCDIKDDGNGNYAQNNIRGNHVALCREGRAGMARIVDSKMKDAGDYSWFKGYINGDLQSFNIDSLINSVKSKKRPLHANLTGKSGNVYTVFIDGNLESDVEKGSNMSIDIIVEYPDRQQKRIISKDFNSWNECQNIFNTFKNNFRDSVDDSKVKDEFSGIRNGITYWYDNGEYFIRHKNGKVERIDGDTFEKVDDLYKYIDNIRDSKIKDSNYIYEFYYNDIDNEDKRMMRKYNLEVVGKSGKGRGERNLAVKGSLENLKRYAKDWLGYELHPDYLIPESQFAYDMYDSIKDSKIEKVAPELLLSASEWLEDKIYIERKYHVKIYNITSNKGLTVTGSRQDLEKLYKDYHMGEYGVKIVDSKMQDATKFYIITKYKGQAEICESLDKAMKLKHSSTSMFSGGNVYEVNSNINWYRQTEKTEGQGGVYSDLLSDVRKGIARIVDSKVKDDDESWFEMLLKRALKEHEKEFSSNISPMVANRVAKKCGVKIAYIKNSKEYLYKYTYIISDSKAKDSKGMKMSNAIKMLNIVNAYKKVKDADTDARVIKNTGLAYEVWNGDKMVKKFPTKKLAAEWIRGRFPTDKITEA